MLAADELDRVGSEPVALARLVLLGALLPIELFDARGKLLCTRARMRIQIRGGPLTDDRPDPVQCLGETRPLACPHPIRISRYEPAADVAIGIDGASRAGDAQHRPKNQNSDRTSHHEKIIV